MGENLIPTQQGKYINDPSNFAIKYLQRLHLNPMEFVQNPNIENLRKIQEAHLQYIPFENLSQHGCTYPATVTDMNAVAEKIIDQKRGGFCFELNGLLAELLIELGYIVCRVPAHVYIESKLIGDIPLHLMLIVSCPEDTTAATSSSIWMVDVGFGEPAIHPLRYDSFDEIQITPDGMQSKIAKVNDGSDDVIMYWWYSSLNKWVPRLKWKYTDSMLGVNGPSQSSFDPFLKIVLDESSIFSQKLICCRLTRDQKLTVAGNLVKITGPPRFVVEKANDSKDPDNGTDPAAKVQSQTSPPVDTRYIESEDELQQILQDHFGIPIESTKGIALAKSRQAHPNIWSNM